MSFRDQSWSARFGKLGDEAEGKFEESREKVDYVRWGLNRPPFSVVKLPARIRNAPDFLTASSLIECKGFGREQVLRLKIEAYNSLHFWNQVHPVELFVWDSKYQRSTLVPLAQVDRIVAAKDGGVTLGHFPENKGYFSIPAEALFSA